MTKTIFLILVILLMLALVSCSVVNTPAGSTTPPANGQSPTFTWPPFPTSQNITTWYLWGLAAATTIVGITLGYNALLLVVLLGQFVTGLFFYVLVLIVTGLLFIRADDGAKYAFRSAAVAGAVIVIAEAFMTMLAPGGTGVFITELVAGVIVFAIWRGFSIRHEDNETSETSYDGQGHQVHKSSRQRKTSVKAGKPS